VSRANLIMLAIGLVAILAGTLLLLRRGGTEAARTAKRMAGTMATALGIFLIIFAIGLSGDAAKGAVR
jgi:hypothetical protein